MPISAKDYERHQVHDRAEWLRWLEAKYATAPGLWLVTFRAVIIAVGPGWDSRSGRTSRGHQVR